MDELPLASDRSITAAPLAAERHGALAAWRPYLLLVAFAVVAGVHWPIAKTALRDVPAFTYGSVRAVVGLAAVVAALAAQRRRLRLPDRRDLPIVLSVGLGQMAAGIALMNLALGSVAAGRSSILLYTMPLWVAVMQLPALRARRDPRQIAGLVVGLAGVALLLNPGAIEWGSGGQLLGSAELLISAVIWGATTIHVRHHNWHATPLDLEPWQLLVAIVPLAAAAIVVDAGEAAHWGPGTIAAVLYSGGIATALSFWLSQSVSRSLSPLATTMGFLGVPIVGVLSSAVLLGEPLSGFDLAGAAAAFAGIVLVSLRSREPAAAAGSPISSVPGG